MADRFDPLIKSLGADYDDQSQIFDVTGYKSGTHYMTGESLVLIVGYDKQKRDNNEKSIIQVIPVLLYLPSYPSQDIMPNNWTHEYIRRVINTHLHWDTFPRSTTYRQFYQRFVASNRPQQHLRVEAISAHFPMIKEFFKSLEWLRVRVYDRLSIIYKREGEEKIHLADGYIIHTTVPMDSDKAKCVDEFLTPVFVSDEDTIVIQPNSTELGKLNVSVPLDSQYVITAVSQNTASRFKSRRVQYEGINIETKEHLKLDEEAEYKGSDFEFTLDFLGSFTTLNDFSDPSTHTYISETHQTASHVGTHVITTPAMQIKSYTIGQVYLPYDQVKQSSLDNLSYTTLVHIPYYGNHIVKMFPIKLSNCQELRLEDKDYINPRI